MGEELRFNEAMGPVVSIAFGRWWPESPTRSACIEVWFKDPDTGDTTTVMWREGEESDLFPKLLRVKQVFDAANEAAKRVEARRVASFSSRTRQPPKTTINLEDLL